MRFIACYPPNQNRKGEPVASENPCRDHARLALVEASSAAASIWQEAGEDLSCHVVQCLREVVEFEDVVIRQADQNHWGSRSQVYRLNHFIQIVEALAEWNTNA